MPGIGRALTARGVKRARSYGVSQATISRLAAPGPFEASAAVAAVTAHAASTASARVANRLQRGWFEKLQVVGADQVRARVRALWGLTRMLIFAARLPFRMRAD
jgi:hypothetical protein